MIACRWDACFFINPMSFNLDFRTTYYTVELWGVSIVECHELRSWHLGFEAEAAEAALVDHIAISISSPRDTSSHRRKAPHHFLTGLIEGIIQLQLQVLGRHQHINDSSSHSLPTHCQLRPRLTVLATVLRSCMDVAPLILPIVLA
jgi:hypothetical protein